MAKNITTAPSAPQTPDQRGRALAIALQLVGAGKLQLTRAQAEQLAKTAAPLTRAGLLTQDEQIRLATLLASQARMRYCE